MPIKVYALLIDSCICRLKEQSRVHTLLCSHALLGNLLDWYRTELLPKTENTFKTNMTSDNFFQTQLLDIMLWYFLLMLWSNILINVDLKHKKQEGLLVDLDWACKEILS